MCWLKEIAMTSFGVDRGKMARFTVSWDVVADLGTITKIVGFLTGQAVLPARKLAGAVGQLMWNTVPAGAKLGIFADLPRRVIRNLIGLVPRDVLQAKGAQSGESFLMPFASEEQLVGILDATGLIAGTVFAVVSDQGGDWARKYFREPELYLDLPDGWYPVAGMGYQHHTLALVGRFSVQEVRQDFREHNLGVSVTQAVAGD